MPLLHIEYFRILLGLLVFRWFWLFILHFRSLEIISSVFEYLYFGPITRLHKEHSKHNFRINGLLGELLDFLPNFWARFLLFSLIFVRKRLNHRLVKQSLYLYGRHHSIQFFLKNYNLLIMCNHILQNYRFGIKCDSNWKKIHSSLIHLQK